MSSEFCESYGYFFWQTLENAVETHLESRNAPTKILGEILKELAPVAYAVAHHEASDSGFDHPLKELMLFEDKLPELQKRLREFTFPYKEVMKSAVRQYIKDQEIGAKSEDEGD